MNAHIGEICEKRPYVLSISEPIDKVFDIFRLEKIKSLPIEDEQRIVNLITINQLDTLLIQDIKFDLTYDFFSLDEPIVDTEIYHRP